MKKSNFVAMILGTIGMVFFALGMCFSMVFGKMILGVVIGLIGIVVLLMLIPFTRGVK